MPKGREHAPATERDGIWYQHRGMGPVGWPPKKVDHTSTGHMLNAQFHPLHNKYPPQPPTGFQKKHAEKDFKHSNQFSSHETRNSIQGYGEYFGDGFETRMLGRRLKSAEFPDLHFADPDEFYERSATNLEYRSIYHSSYPHKQGQRAHKARFPRVYPEPQGGSNTGGGECAASAGNLTTTTSTWFREPDVPYRTPLQVLASSHEPFLKQNPWKYAYNGLPDVYPPYHTSPPHQPRPLQTWLLMDQKPKHFIKKSMDEKRVISVN